jgi:outer membrane protein assembly factor BamB
VAVRLTTRCCSVIVAIVAVSVVVVADRPLPPLALFPVRVAWSVDIPDVAAPAAFGSDRAFVALDGNLLVSYDLRTGVKSWQVTGRASAAPVADGPLVFVVDGQQIIAYRSDTGEGVWSTSLSAAPSAAIVSRGGWLMVPLETGVLMAYRAADGARVWERDVGSPAQAPPTIDGDRVFVPTRDGRVVALAVRDGAPIWQRRLGGSAQQIVALDRRLYLGSLDNFFYSLNADNGEVRWRWRAGADIVGAPAIDDDRVYFVSLDNVVRSVDRHSGGQRWRRTLASRPRAGPLLAAGTVLVWGISGAAQAFLVKDGAPAGDLEAGGPLAGPIHVLEPPTVPLPMVVRVTRSLKGTRLSAVTRDVEPTLAPVGPLPNAVPVEPTSMSLTSRPTSPGSISSPNRDR